MNANRKFKLLTVLTLTAACSFAQSVRDLRLDTPVDSNTIAVAYAEVANAIATAVRLGQLDQASLARAVAVGQDLALIESATNGWVVAVSNIVEVDQASIPGVLLVGDTIFGAPSSSKGRIDIDGCDFYYNRQIPGDSTHTNGWGNLVTDPYLDWRLGSFFSDWDVQTNAMWAALETLAGLPDTIAGDLATYNSLTNVQADVTAIRDDINATNAVIYATISNALAQASSGGGGQSWTTATTSSSTIDLADHCITICDNSSDYEFTLVFPNSTGTAHAKIVFSNAYSLGENGAYMSFSMDGTWYGVDNCSGFYRYDEYSGSSIYYSFIVLDIWEAGENTWLIDWRGMN